MPRVRKALGRAAVCALILLVLLAAMAILVQRSPATPSGSPSNPLASGRDPYLWPFAPSSIWNLPIGAGAAYVPAHIKQAAAYGMTTDQDVLILTPTAPSTPVYQNNAGWSGGSRCGAQGSVLFNGPMPSGFIVPDAGSGSTPNFSTAILMPDNHTLAQGQPMARCSAGGPATMMWYQENEDLYGVGITGAHGGSMLSSIGGTLRLGELVPGGVIRHALKVNLYGHDDYWYDATTRGYRWPASTADSYASSTYAGSVPALRMGSLLALAPSINLNAMGLETAPALILAKAFQDYGAYVVDDAAWSVYAIETEFSPNGHVEDQFQSVWGFTMTPSSKNAAWARDMDRIFGNLSVVDNWDHSKYNEVAASNGSEGAGGGAPRVAWAPPFGSPSPANQVTVSSPASGARMTPGQQVTVAWTSSGSLQANSAALSFSSDGGSTWNSPFATGKPLNGSVSWQVPNVVTNQAVIRVVVKATGGQDVEGRSGTFAIASAGSPVASFSYTPAWPKPGSTIAFDASSSTPSVPGVTLDVRWDWQNDGVWDTPWSTTLTAQHAYAAEGNCVVRVEVGESSGASDNATQGVTVDGTPPVTTATVSGTPGAGGWYTTAATVTLSATDALSGVASTLVRIDGGAWTAYSAPIALTDGQHQVAYQSTDRAGNAESAHTVLVPVDTAPPTTTASLKGAMYVNGSYAGPVNVTLAASDATSGVASTRYRLDGGAWLTYDSTFGVTGFGTHTVEFASTDVAGNVEATESKSFTIVASSPPSSQPPVSTLTLSGTMGPDGWYMSWVNVTLSASSPAGLAVTIAYRLDGGPWRTYGAPFPVPDGIHSIDYNATDSASNAEATRTASFRDDSVRPVTVANVTGTRGRDHWWTSSVLITLVASDATSGVASTVYSLDGGTWQTYTASFRVGNGRHVLEFRSTDVAGLTESATSTGIKVDSSSPKVSVSAPTVAVTTSQATLTWIGTDDLAGVVDNGVSVDGGAYVSVGLNETATLTLADGSHVIRVRVLDDAGNAGEAQVTLRVDTNIFSFTGPYAGIPTLVVIGGILAVAFGGVLRRRAARRNPHRGKGM